MGQQNRTMPKNDGKGQAEWLGTATTGTTRTSIPNYGVSVISSAANTWVLDAPVAGVVKHLVSVTTGSSAARLVKLSPVSSGDSITLVGSTAHTEIVFHTTDVARVSLLGISDTQWLLMHATTGAGPVNTTGIVFQVS